MRASSPRSRSRTSQLGGGEEGGGPFEGREGFEVRWFYGHCDAARVRRGGGREGRPAAQRELNLLSMTAEGEGYINVPSADCEVLDAWRYRATICCGT